jgi:RNA polymerase sigma-70 factor, ECF subfamily
LRTGLSRSTSQRDQALESAFSRGDAAAYETVYRLFGDRMYTTALHLLRDAGTARECVHDVLLQLWKRPDAYDRRRGDLEAFLVACTRNQALMRLRGDRRRRQVLERLDPAPDRTFDDDPIERERVARALARLPREQAEAIQLAYYRGFTLAQIAAERDLPLGTVKSRISAALRSLRLALVVENGE